MVLQVLIDGYSLSDVCLFTLILLSLFICLLSFIVLGVQCVGFSFFLSGHSPEIICIFVLLLFAHLKTIYAFLDKGQKTGRSGTTV